MAMSILFRTNKADNDFREALLELINSGGKGDTLILSYGNISSKIARDKDFIESVKKGFPRGGVIQILGSYADKHRVDSNGDYIPCGSKCSFCYLLDFVKQLETKLNSEKLSVTVELYFVEYYHAKIAMKLMNDYPIATITGSSNLSGRTFEKTGDWNRECDIYIIDDEVIHLSSFVHTKYMEDKEYNIESHRDIIEAFYTRRYALDIIPVDCKYPDKLITERLYSELKTFLVPQYRAKKLSVSSKRTIVV